MGTEQNQSNRLGSGRFVRLLVSVPLTAGLMLSFGALNIGVASAATPTVELASSSQWGPDSIGDDHVVGEVVNVGPGNADFPQVVINLYNSANTLLATDTAFTNLSVLAPGEKSSFDDPFTPPAGYSYARIGSVSASAGGTGNHNFTTLVTNTYTDSIGEKHIVGTVSNDNSTMGSYVEVEFTFYNSSLTAVGSDSTFVNTNSSSDVGAGQTAPFDEIVPSGIPAYTSYSMVSHSSTSAPSGVSMARTYGTDAIGTAIAVGQSEYPAAGSASAVVLARSDAFPDALAGGPLAANVGGPLLITPGAALSQSIDPRVLAEIKHVLPTGNTVYIIGGPLAISTSVDSTLTSLGYVVKRVYGQNQYATAVAIANQLGNPSTLFEATGTNFADALSAVPAAIQANGAILLTDGNTQAPETATYLSQHPSDTRYAIGGPLAAAGADPGATAVYGQDQYGTSAAVATKFFPSATTFGSATGINFPDALGGGVFMGMANHLGPVLLVQPTAPLPPTVSNYLSSTKASLIQGYLFGGPLAVASSTQAALVAAG